MKAFLVVFLFSTSVLARTEIAFQGEVEVSAREKLTWADIAVVKQGTNDFLNELKQIPYDGGGLSEIRERLRGEKSVSDIFKQVDPKVTLSYEFKIKKVQGYSSAELRRKALNIMGAACNACQFEIKSTGDQNIHMVSNWAMDESTVKPTGQMLVSISGGGETTWVSVRAKVMRQGIVPKHMIPFGQRLLPADFEQKLVDVSTMNDMPASFEDLKGTVLIRSMGITQIVAIGDLRREDLVQRGQSVKVTTGSDDFEITSTALAEQNGRNGDVVKIKFADSGREVSAIVTGSAEVRLQ